MVYLMIEQEQEYKDGGALLILRNQNLIRILVMKLPTHQNKHIPPFLFDENIFSYLAFSISLPARHYSFRTRAEPR